MRSYVLSLGFLAALAVLLPLTSSLTVHVVPHTHDDVGWLKTVDQYYYGLYNEIQHAAVQYIIKSVVAALARNPQRKFMYVEQAFFQRYWREANDYDKNLTRSLVKNGQLEFVNGGWCMHDEAAAHYIDMIDQTTLGHKFIVEEFGASAVPTIGWQIDPFGHSSTQASLLSAEVGFDGLFFGRIDYQGHIRSHTTRSPACISRGLRPSRSDDLRHID
jgi:alpha-mannosidase